VPDTSTIQVGFHTQGVCVIANLDDLILGKIVPLRVFSNAITWDGALHTIKRTTTLYIKFCKECE